MGIETAIIMAAIIGATASVGTSMYSAQAERTSQKKALNAQADAVKQAEQKAKAAESLAEQTAADKIKKQRASQTQTILTSPLGINDQAPVTRTTLGAG